MQQRAPLWPEKSESQTLGRRVRRRLCKYVRRTPRMLTEILGDMNGLEEVLSEPEAVPFLVIGMLAFAAVVMVLGGVLALVQEAFPWPGQP